MRRRSTKVASLSLNEESSSATDDILDLEAPVESLNQLLSDQVTETERTEDATSSEKTSYDAKDGKEGGDDDDDDDDDNQLDAPPYLKLAKEKFSLVWKLVIIGVLIGYSIWAYVLDFSRARPLFILEILVVSYIVARYIARNFFWEQLSKLEEIVINFLDRCGRDRRAGVACIGLMVVLALLGVSDFRNLVSAFGIVMLVAITYVTSWKPRKIKWRPVLSGILLQILLAFFILKTRIGYEIFYFLGEQITILLEYTRAGSSFVFGYLVDTDLFQNAFQLADGSEYFLSPPFYFNVLSTLFFTASLINILYYIGVVDFIVGFIGYILAVCMGTSAAEALSASVNIFIGQTDAPILIKGYMPNMTDSELHSVMTGGFASIAGALLGAYASFGIPAQHLLAASVMSAPAAMAVSKLVYPETSTNVRTAIVPGRKFELTKSEDSNMFGAAAGGANLALQQVLGIGAQLIAFLSLLAMLDGFLAGIGSLVNLDLSFTLISSYIFYPLSWLMGVAPQDCLLVATLLGYKVFTNEFIAYVKLAEMAKQGLLQPKSVVIATYALCGFSNVSSIGLQIGALTPLAPEKAKSFSKLALSAMIAGNTACLMTGATAGLLFDPDIDGPSLSN